uniref:KIB1-4 beta-propeller domain-containing protein n=1 Tax=Fagus sylvatica TaxID=28930 RepID=A0A2N9J6Q0_FAGSY
MRLVTQLPDFFRAGVFFQLAIFIAISLTRRYVISSSSIRVTLLMMVLISAFLSPVQAGDQDMSFIESTLRILTSFTPSSSLQTSNYPNWSELPTDMIGEIVNRLPNFMDIKAIVAVSDVISWNYPQFVENVVGVLHMVWVVTLDPDYDIHIENLDQRIEPIALPPLDTIRRELAGREEWFRLVHKFIIFKEPAESDHGLSFLVFAIFGPENRLAFARPGRDEWTIFTNPNNLEFKDVARLQGQIWGLCDNGLLVRFEFEGTQLLKGFFWRRRSYKTTDFSVFKFNFSDSEWEEVNDLGDHALFVGDCNSWCIPTIPQIRVNDGSFVRSNSIYFTDDNWEWQMLAGVAYGGHDVGVFDMERRVIQRLPFGKDTPLYYSRPIWVTPNLIRNG